MDKLNTIFSEKGQLYCQRKPKSFPGSCIKSVDPLSNFLLLLGRELANIGTNVLQTYIYLLLQTTRYVFLSFKNLVTSPTESISCLCLSVYPGHTIQIKIGLECFKSREIDSERSTISSIKSKHVFPDL